MSVLTDSDMVQLNSPVDLCNVWKGQIFIQEQLVCDIALQSSSNCSIPAQLPEKLEIKEVIRLSELRKELPEHLFQKADFTGQEVRCESVYYNLYPAIISNVIGLELDKLLKWLKDQDLAIIKVLNDQGFLILVTSSILQNNEGFDKRDSSQLNALFLFPHTKLLNKREREEWKCRFNSNDISLKISNLLPGLQYAIVETSHMRKNKNIFPDSLVERYFKRYAILQKKRESSSDVKAEESGIPFPFTSHENDVPEKCGQLAFSRLQFYFSSPVNFSIPLIKVSTLLTETTISSDKSSKNGGTLVGHDAEASATKLSLAVEAKAGSENPHGNHALHGSIAKSSKKIALKKGGKRRAKKGKRKLTHKAAPVSTETRENQASIKRRKILSEDQKQVGSSSKGTVQVGSSSKGTVKLACDPFPQRRKRGAEVLTAEFVQDEKIKMPEKIVLSKRNEVVRSKTPKSTVVKRKPRKKILAPEDHFLVLDTPPRHKVSEPEDRDGSPENFRIPVEKHGEKAGRQFNKLETVKNDAIEQINPFSKSNADLGLSAKQSSLFTQIPDDSMIEKRISMYESHALNLLADLALNSFCSSSFPYVQSECVASREEPVVSEKANTGNSASTVEYTQKDCSLSVLPSPASKEPEQQILEGEKDQTKNEGDAKQGNTVASQQRIENHEKPISLKVHVAAAKAKARFNTTSKISLEHSYSQLPLEEFPDNSSKEANEQPVQSVAEPTVITPATEVVAEKSSKVFLPGEILFVTSEKLSPAVDKQPRTVSKLEDKFIITFSWEAKYDFDLDSKFTSDPLEKTINRALHGSWNHHLKEKVEDVKIILHMWLALFYSKPNKQLNCSSRKVVEHSNPAKYVSINTVLDPFEFYEIVESDAIELCAADTENTNVNPSMGKKSEAPCQGKLHESSLLHKLEKNQNKNHPEDLSIDYGIPTKDYNVELASEIFQTCKSNESAFYTNSLLTTVKCKSVPQPTHYMKTIFGANVPAACYISDTEQFNSELNGKSENCVDIVGGSSEKVNYKGNVHENTALATENETQQLSGSEHGFKKLNKDSDENKENAKIYETANSSGSASHTQPESSTLHNVKMPQAADEKHKAPEKTKLWITRDYPCVESKNILNAGIPPSSILNVNIISDNQTLVDLSTQNDEHPKHLEKADQYSKESPLDAKMQLTQNVITSVETTLPIAENKDSLDTSVLPVHDVNEDSVVDEVEQVESAYLALQNAEDKELVKTNQILIKNHSTCDLSEGSSHHVKDLNCQRCMDNSSNKTASVDEKALECNRDLSSIDYISTDHSTVESLNTSIQSQPKESEKYRKPDGNEHQTSSSSVSQSIVGTKALELSEITDCTIAINLDCSSNSTEAGKMASSRTANTTPDDMLGKASKDSSDKLNDFVESKEHSKLNKNGAHEITEILTEWPGYSQETEHSYVSKSLEKAGKASPESTWAEQTHSSKEEAMINTAVEDPVPALLKDNSTIPDKGHQICETHNEKIDVQEKDASIVDAADKEEQAMPIHTKFLLSSVLDDDTANPLDVASADPGTKQLEAMNSDVIDINHLHSEDNMEANMSEICEGEDPLGKQKPLLDHEEMPPVLADKSPEDVALTGTDSRKIAECGSNTLFKSLNSKANSDVLSMDVSTEVQKQNLHLDIHSEELSERRSPALPSPSPGVIKNIENHISLEAFNEKTDLSSGSAVVETQVHVLSNNTDTLNNCEMVVHRSETLEMCKEITVQKKFDTVAGKSEFSKSNETTVEPCRSSSTTSDLLVSKHSEIDAEQLPVESEPSDNISNADHLNNPLNAEIIPKDLAHSIRDASSNRKEFLSKLKLICLGSATGQQAHSISEDNVLLVHEKIIDTEEQNELVDPKNKAENVQTLDENKSTPDNTDISVEDTAPDKEVFVEDNLLQEISVHNTSAAESEFLENLDQMPSQGSCISTSNDDFTANIEKDLVQELSDICFIVNTGSISKEQYDRWSETSDEDIEFIQAYKEPLSRQENIGFQKEKHELLSSSLEKLTFSHEPTRSKKPKYFKGQSCPSTMLCEEDEYVSKYHRDLDNTSIRSRENIIVTKNIRDAGRTMHTVNMESSYSGTSDLDNLFSNRRFVSDNLTQNTLDTEHLRFICKLKEVLRKSSTGEHVCEPPFQPMFESKRILGCSSSTAKSRMPLLITVHCPYRRRDLRGLDSQYPSSYYNQGYYEDEIWNRPVFYSRTTKKVRTRRSSPFHFSRLRYENAQDKSNSDISVILKECVNSNHLKLSSVCLGNSAVDRTSASQLAEENSWQARRTFVPVSSKSQPVKNIISELCTSLHSRLHGVARESGPKNVYFYITPTSDEVFFSSTKSLLIKEGHTPTEPQEFCHREHAESNKLLVVIRNEDVSSSINKIPCLLQLKLLPNANFAGVDTPEDMTESTYQELFQAGGFVVSDKTVLENITLGKLKEVLTIIEKMNRTSAWKWLLHYRENRKLKEDKRSESFAKIKLSLLKSYQQSNIIETLPYHQCDSRSKELSDDLACLMSVQCQYIRSRLAVYLTGTPSSVAEEYKQNGILVYDVDSFVRQIQKVNAQLQASCW
ncbi:protein TASOR 2 isoform X3 [Mixophyes fleayi]